MAINHAATRSDEQLRPLARLHPGAKGHPGGHRDLGLLFTDVRESLAQFFLYEWAVLKLSNFGLHCSGVYSIAETRPTDLVDVEAPMSGGRHFPIRSFVASVVLVAVAAASVYLSYELVVKPRRALQDQIRAQQGTILKLQQEKQRLEAYLKILKRIDRRARVEVLRQGKDQQGDLQTTIRFTEVDDTGKPINVSREMTLPGQEVYFDTLVIKFDDHFIEQGDPLKGGALMVFRRIFSSTMRPEDGVVIDKDGQVPQVYAERQATNEFEKDLWRRFWDFANDEKLARERGVRAIHGDAPYMRLEPDRVYEICLRSTGEVIITPGTRMAPQVE